MLDDPFGDRRAVDEMFLQDALEPFWCDAPVPDSVRVNDEPRSFRADAKTGRFRAHHLQAAFFQTRLHVLPGLISFPRFAAVGADAEKEMFFRAAHGGFF